jgi:hypothetical protein
MRVRWSLVGLVLASGAALADPDFVILVDDGKQAGQVTIEPLGDQRFKSTYIFKDNGRGPEDVEEYTVGGDGFLDRYRATGKTTFGSPIDDRYERSNGRAEWKSTTESGSASDVAGAQYLPMNATPAQFGVALKALAASVTQSIRMVPTGTLRQELIETVEIEDDAGKPRSVRLVALSGLGMTPEFVWTTDAAEPDLFAQIYPGYAYLAPPGFKQAQGKLTEHQLAAEGKLLIERAKALRQTLPGLTVIRNARVFNSVTGALGAPQDVYFSRGKISAVLPTGLDVPVQQSIDAAGRSLLPGLFDMHGHLSSWDGALHLAGGVTTVRDMGNDNATLQRLIDELERGELLGPKVVPAGFLEGESPMSARNGFVVADLEGAKKAIDWYAAHGYPTLKIYNSFPRKILQETVAYAHDRGMRVGGHIPAFLRARDAVEAGFDEISHINQVLLNFLVQDDTDTRTLARFYLPAAQVGDLDFDGKPVRDYIALLEERQVSIDPTLSTFDFLRQRDG